MKIFIIIFLVIAFIVLAFVLFVAYKNYKKNDAEFKEWQKKTDGIYAANEDWYPDNNWF